MVLFLVLFLVSLITRGLSHSQACDNLTCLDSHSYCDKDNICRCEPEYPVHVELYFCRQEKKYKEKCDYTAECYYYDKNSHCSQSSYRSLCECNNDFFYNQERKRCMKGKKYNEECDHTAECYYYDKNSYCSQLPYRSVCECGNAYFYNEIKKRCMKVFGDYPKTSYLVSPTAFGVFFGCAGIICGGFLLWYICKRPNEANSTFSRTRRTSQSHYFSSDRGSQIPVCVATAPTFEEIVPTQIFSNAAFSRSRMTPHSNYLTSCQGHHRPICIPSAPTLEEPLPTYDTALSLKVTEDCEPPSYKDVFPQVSNSKT